MSRRRFNLVVARAPGVVVIETDGDRALWSSGVSRTSGTCALSEKPYEKGDRTYRPIGNQQYRYLRIRADALHEAIEALGGFQHKAEDEMSHALVPNLTPKGMTWVEKEDRWILGVWSDDWDDFVLYACHVLKDVFEDGEPAFVVNTMRKLLSRIYPDWLKPPKRVFTR